MNNIYVLLFKVYDRTDGRFFTYVDKKMDIGVVNMTIEEINDRCGYLGIKFKNNKVLVENNKNIIWLDEAGVYRLEIFKYSGDARDIENNSTFAYISDDRKSSAYTNTAVKAGDMQIKLLKAQYSEKNDIAKLYLSFGNVEKALVCKMFNSTCKIDLWNGVRIQVSVAGAGKIRVM